MEVTPRTSLQLRLEFCLETVIQVQDALIQSESETYLSSGFDQLRKVLDKMNELNLTEEDLDRIEKVTNQLLGDLKALLAAESIPAAADQPIN